MDYQGLYLRSQSQLSRNKDLVSCDATGRATSRAAHTAISVARIPSCITTSSWNLYCDRHRLVDHSHRPDGLSQASIATFTARVSVKLEEWARQGSNLGPAGYEPDALPLSYGPVDFNLSTRPPSCQERGVKERVSLGDAQLVLVVGVPAGHATPGDKLVHGHGGAGFAGLGGVGDGTRLFQ